MAKQTVTNATLLKLRGELESILSQSLNGLVKYKFITFQNSVLKTLEPTLKIQEELIKKYGEQTPVGMIIQPFVKDELGVDVKNEKFDEFAKEFEPILEQTEEFKYKELPESIFEDITIAKHVVAIFGFITTTEEAA